MLCNSNYRTKLKLVKIRIVFQSRQCCKLVALDCSMCTMDQCQGMQTQRVETVSEFQSALLRHQRRVSA